MPSLCCFWCPNDGFQNRLPDEKCSICKRAYIKPLIDAPTEIREYSIESPISRGFYGAVYRAKQKSLNRTVVLKVVPQAIYTYFKKDWAAECTEHAAIAEGTSLIAAITDRFDETVSFGGESLACHIAVLTNVPGPTLQEILREPHKYNVSPRAAAQIAADLFEVMHAFSQNQRFHNDLHAGNVIVQRLSGSAMRLGAIDPSTRAVAVDLGSVKDASQSGDGRRFGDHTHVASHIGELARVVRAGRDIDHRIAGALRGLAEHLVPTAGAQRVMTSEDAFRTLKRAIEAADEPWRQPLALARFGDAYNAQALEAWHVPALWFDPDGRWLARTKARGPQVITGMRGCGKTMLLRALHFHARATTQVDNDPAYRTDEFIGVYASCQKLLDPQGRGDQLDPTSIPLPFERLFVAYLRDAVQVLKHLRSNEPDAFVGRIDTALQGALQLLEVPAGVIPADDEVAFDQALTDLQFKLADGSAGYRLRLAPAEAFGQLANVIRSATSALAGKYVLFLLDDVSTRYLQADVVRLVISQLLFQHPHCAFRITTEAQALHKVLLSPGGSAPADPNRDYEEFDLGHEVHRLLNASSVKARSNFVSEILSRRGQQFADPIYRVKPIDVLGDVTLEDIAREIGTSSPTSADRKKVYRGLRALQAVCVGDLGDVVKLYEKILQHADPAVLPVPSHMQTECFLGHSAGLMHFLNRRDQQKKSLALAFAQASGELLYRSAKSGKSRIRQYTKLYVRVDSGPDFGEVSNRILDLLDAGVFVYDGGVPRTKTRDSDPVLQFKLAYRKMLGLASFIPLSGRDRFELSGENLKRWLKDPSQAKDILLESESSRATSNAAESEAESEPESDAEPQEQVRRRTKKSVKRAQGSRKTLQRKGSVPQLSLVLPPSSVANLPDVCAPKLGIGVVSHNLADWGRLDIDVLVLALGFEERSRVSAERLLAVLRPKRIVLVKYSGEAQGSEIQKLVNRTGIATTTIDSWQLLNDALPSSDSEIVVDSTALSKPFLFVAVQRALRTAKRVKIVHTLARNHYPRNEDLAAIGVTRDSPISSEVLESMGKILIGETGPYRLIQVDHTEGSPDRSRALIASASPKNDRLLHLLGWRPCEATKILVPTPTTARRRVARASAELAASAADANVSLEDVDTNDIAGALAATERIYNEFYFRAGANVELGLTGSKMHAVAFAALASRARIAATWYVSPEAFDEQRFTEGAGETQCYELGREAE